MIGLYIINIMGQILSATFEIVPHSSLIVQPTTKHFNSLRRLACYCNNDKANNKEECPCGCEEDGPCNDTETIITPGVRGGYFTRAWELFTYHVSAKDLTSYNMLMKDAHKIYKNATAAGQRLWFGPVLGSYLFQRTFVWSNLEQMEGNKYLGLYDFKRLYQLMFNRHEVFDVKENELFDRADALIKKFEGDHLIKEVEGFADYYYEPPQFVLEGFNSTPKPVTFKETMVEDVFYAFIDPFEKIFNSLLCRKLIEDVNIALNRRDGVTMG